MDEIENIVPGVNTEELEKQALQLQQMQQSSEMLQGSDQGQVQTNQSQPQTGSTEPEEIQPDEEDTRTGLQKFLGYDKALTNKANRGEKVTFADTFNRSSSPTITNPLRPVTDTFAAGGAGMVDFAVDAVNLLPKVDIPKLPEYESGVLQGVRQISSIVIPSLYGAKYLKGLGGLAHKKVGWALGNNSLVKFLGTAGIDAGVGGVVDSIVKTNETDDNVAGALKKSWPSTFGWIPDNVATLDSDSPEIKRMKNVNEGIGLSFFGDFLLGANKILKDLKGIDEATQY
jgi:hypothetical protein